MKLRAAFADLPLQRKLLLLVGLAAVVALLVAAVSVVLYESSTYRPRASEQASAHVRSIAATVAAAVEFDDPDTAVKYLSAFGRNPTVRALAIVRPDGSTFAEYVSPGVAPIDFTDESFRRRELARGHFVVMAPIAADAALPAVLWMMVEPRPLADRLLEYAPLLAAAALSLLALTIMLSLTIRRAISEPVQALAAAARDVTKRQDYGRRVPAPRNDEIGQLARDFNSMLAAIEERELALRRSEELARRKRIEIETIYATAEIGLCVVDRDCRYVRINKRLAEMSGRTVDAIVGRTIGEILPDIAPTVAAICRKIFDTGEPVINVEVQVRAPSSQVPHCWMINHHALRDESGAVIGVSMVVLDITDRKRAEQDRAMLEVQLRQSQKMEALGTLAGGIAHDFNNVLTAVAGNAQLALEDLPAEHPANVSLQEIRRGAERARDLVRRILAFSRPEQNVQHLIDLKPVVDEALRLLRATAPRMIDIRLEAEPHLPTVRADATQVHQVLMNLGTNACDAMKDRGGSLTVHLSGVRTDSRLQKQSADLHPGRYLRVSVEDTGTGIDPDLIERVFEPFFTTKAPGEGTGLGLSVVHGIMRGHGGAILVRSKRGAGTVFDLYFPAADAAAEPTETPTAATRGPAGEGERILYVDDEEQLVFLVTRMMERMGYHVTGMTHASDAIAAIRADPRRFDLVISDLGMPGMSGMDLAAELLTIRPDLPIIITSGYVRTEDAERAERIGVRDIVLKPGTVGEMGQLIRDRLDELRLKAGS